MNSPPPLHYPTTSSLPLESPAMKANLPIMVTEVDSASPVVPSPVISSSPLVISSSLSGTATGNPSCDEVGCSSLSPGILLVSKPFVGQTFESMLAAQKHYKDYGKHKKLLLERSEKPEKPEKPEIRETTRRPRLTLKCGCQAQMRVLLNEGEWKVTVFNEEHNHQVVTPSKRICMRQNKHKPEIAKCLSESFQDSNVPVATVVKVLDGDSLGFTERDCYNHLSASRPYKFPKEWDATSEFSYFKKKSVSDPQFFYHVQVDHEGMAINFFWVDGRSRAQYKHFGDVVVFDTTYKRNSYAMPFGPFTGVNHHSQSIQFGCGLLFDETEDCFEWLFRTWLEAMSGVPPVSIITDQDQAMGNAIKKVFPDTRYRYCLWHIEVKFPEHFPHLYSKKADFKDELKWCLWWPFKVEQFEMRWKKLLEDFNLVENVWLKGLYEIREKWVPVYLKDTFFAGMNTSNRSESMNAVFKKYFSHNTSLLDFVQNYEKLLDNIASNERKEDYQTEHLNRILDAGDSYVLHDAAKLYTRWRASLNRTKTWTLIRMMKSGKCWI